MKNFKAWFWESVPVFLLGLVFGLVICPDSPQDRQGQASIRGLEDISPLVEALHRAVLTDAEVRRQMSLRCSLPTDPDGFGDRPIEVMGVMIRQGKIIVVRARVCDVEISSETLKGFYYQYCPGAVEVHRVQ